MVETPPTSAQHYAACLVTLTIATIFIAARLYTRAHLTRNLGMDDGLIFVCWLGHIAFSVIGTQFPSIRDTPIEYKLTPHEVIITFQYAFASRLIYQFCLFLSKLAIACFYLRIFQDRRSRHHIYAMIAFIVLAFIPTQLLGVFICWPVQDYWSLASRHCSPPNPGIYANAISNIVADIWMMAFVFPRIINLRMALRQRISLLIILSLGLIVIAASVVRLIHSTRGFADASSTTVRYWNGFQISLWSAVEITVSIICASAPCIRPLVLKIAPRFIQTSDRSRSSNALANRSRPKSSAHTPSTLLSQLSAKNKSHPSTNSHGEGFTTTTHSFVGDVGGSKTGSDKGDDLERGVYSEEGSERELYMGYALSSGMKLDGEIVKTMSFTISDEQIPIPGPATSEGDLASDKGTVRYNHV